MIPCTLLSLEMEGNTSQGMWWLLEAESGPWLIASKEMGTWSYSCWELGSANDEKEFGSKFFPTASG